MNILIFILVMVFWFLFVWFFFGGGDFGVQYCLFVVRNKFQEAKLEDQKYMTDMHCIDKGEVILFLKKN